MTANVRRTKVESERRWYTRGARWAAPVSRALDGFCRRSSHCLSRLVGIVGRAKVFVAGSMVVSIFIFVVPMSSCEVMLALNARLWKRGYHAPAMFRPDVQCRAYGRLYRRLERQK